MVTAKQKKINGLLLNDYAEYYKTEIVHSANDCMMVDDFVMVPEIGLHSVEILREKIDLALDNNQAMMILIPANGYDHEDI